MFLVSSYGMVVALLVFNSKHLHMHREGLMCILIGAMFEVDYDDPFDTAEQLVNKNITFLMDPSFVGSDWRHWLSKSSDPWHQKLSESAVKTSNTIMFNEKTKYGLLSDGIHAILTSYLGYWELNWGYRYNQGMGWYKSKYGVGNMPISGYLTGKKWPLIEELSLHLLYFQQVQYSLCLCSNEYYSNLIN